MRVNFYQLLRYYSTLLCTCQVPVVENSLLLKNTLEQGRIRMFYEHFVNLCRERHLTPSRAAIEAGLSKSTVTKWKNAPDARPTGKAIEALTAYFGITVGELLGFEEPAAGSDRRPTEEEIKFALFGGSGEITDEMYQEVLSFAAFVRQREAQKKKE